MSRYRGGIAGPVTHGQARGTRTNSAARRFVKCYE